MGIEIRHLKHGLFLINHSVTCTVLPRFLTLFVDTHPTMYIKLI